MTDGCLGHHARDAGRQPSCSRAPASRIGVADAQLANIDAPIVQRPERRPVADGDDGGTGQALTQQRVDQPLGRLVE